VTGLVRTSLAGLVAALALGCGRTPRTSPLPYRMPSGKPIAALGCSVVTDQRGVLRVGLDYLSESRDPRVQRAEAFAVVREMGPAAERAGVGAFALYSFRRHWKIRRRGRGRLPSLAQWTSAHYSFVRCDDGRWDEERTCKSAPKPAETAVHLGDGTAADPRVMVCGAGVPASLPPAPRPTGAP
jgi:hypothetical protein